MTTEGNTFSQLIDEAIQLTGRGPAARPRLIAYSRSSMREAQVKALFHKDRNEDILTVDASPFIWTPPVTIRIVETVIFPNEVYPDFITPSRKQRLPSSLGDAFYYAAQNYYVFSGVDINDAINISYFTYFSPLLYFTIKERPARFDLETLTWEYLDNDGNHVSSLSTTALEQAARDKVTNWMIFNWFELILEGTLAKQFKIVKDERARTSFALFEKFKTDLLIGEPCETLGV